MLSESSHRLKAEGAGLYSELWQFAGLLGLFAVAFVLWMWIVYLPGRSLERWEDRRVGARKEPPASSKREA